MCVARARCKAAPNGETHVAKVLEPDICVIGGGAAALAVIKTARAAGASVALVTRGTADGAQLDAAMLGARALAAAAARAHRLRHSEHLGIVATEPQIDFEGVHAHVRQAIAQDALRFSSERLAALGATLLPGPSRFLDRTQMEVGDTLVKARRFVIATGSRPNVPELPGLQDSGYLTPETLLGLSERPDDLIVLGGTAEAFELAQAYLRLGSRVTVIDALEPLGEEDPELAGIVLRRLEREGLEIHRHTGVVAVRSDGNGIAVDLKAGAAEWTLPGSHLLIATGWQPDLDGLGLDAARIRFSSAGIAVNSGLRTSNRRVYAIGEAIGGGRSASAATHQGIVVTRNALHRHPASHDRRIVPQVTFTDPEIARVGLTEPEARERHRQHY